HKSTLFPYTTLFRSRPLLPGAGAEEPDRPEGRRRPSYTARSGPSRADRGGRLAHGIPVAAAARRGPRPQGPLREESPARKADPRDRKSTRLNSSHVA